MKLKLTIVSLLLSGALLAQTPSAGTPASPGGEAQANYQRLKVNILKAADKMPATDYQFKPTPDIRTYARVVNHITEAQFRSCTVLNGATFEANKVPSDTADKQAIVEGLKASFDECDKAYGSLLDAQLVPIFNTKRSRLGIAWGNVSHDNEQYATLSLYLRLKGLVPPTSEK